MNEDLSVLASQLAKEDFCYVTTKGRVSGRPHEIEIWFVPREPTFTFCLAAGINQIG
jgi:hypothetical protein